MRSQTSARRAAWVAAGLACFLLVVAGCGGAPPEEPAIWYCPMHPEITSDEPGSCPICHMDLVRRQPGDGRSAAAVPGVAGAVPVRGAATVAVAYERALRTVRTVGRVVADERRTTRVETRYSGWIVGLDADFTGAPVRRGQRLATIDSPELYGAQREYLAARRAARRLANSSLPEVRSGADELVRAARRRLELLELPAGFVDRLEESGEVSRTLEIAAPQSGFLEAKEVVLGQRVEAGMELFTLRDLSRIWIEADVYEGDAASARVGQQAEITSPFDPELRLEARATYLDPELDLEARTLRVRFEVANPVLALRPGMFVDVEIALGELAGPAVPDAAVVATGERTLVFVEEPSGRYSPREVRLAGRQGGRAWIAEGLVAGERVAAEPAFLLDSESRLREAALRRGGETESVPAPAAADGHEGHR